MSESVDTTSMEQRKFQLEQSRFRYDVLKWAIAVLGGVASFYVIDLGKLKLEQFRVRAENQRALLQSYLGATESVQPDVWKRKLNVLQTFSDDPNIQIWAGRELENLQNYAALDALYRETLKVASQLVSSRTLNDPARQTVRARYEQLYWADLPFAKESTEVDSAMAGFRKTLIEAERNPSNPEAWRDLETDLLSLSKALQRSMPVSVPAKPK